LSGDPKQSKKWFEMARQFMHTPNQWSGDNTEEHTDTKAKAPDNKKTHIEGTIYVSWTWSD
jgi:hypothetical protein